MFVPFAFADVAVAEMQATVHVRFDGEGDAALYRAREGADAELVCRAPCEVDLPVNGNYRVSGQGLQTTKWFQLMAPDDGDIEIFAGRGSHAGKAVGITLAALGGAGVVVSFLGLIAVTLRNSICLMDCQSYPERGRDQAIALGGMALGAVVTGVGALVYSQSLSTNVEQKISPERTPTWRPPTAESAPRTVPVLFTMSF